MTVYTWECMGASEDELRMRYAHGSLCRLIETLKTHQQLMPHVADSLQGRIDGLVMRRDSYANAIKRYDAELGTPDQRLWR